MTSAEPRPCGNRLDLTMARHAAAHLLMHLHFSQRCHSREIAPEGSCGGFPPGADPMFQWLEAWRQDVTDGGGFREEMVTANGRVASAAPWSLAFCRANSELIDDAATVLINASAGGDSDGVLAPFRGRTADPDQEELDAAELSFTGGWHALELVDEAVAEYRAGEHA